MSTNYDIPLPTNAKTIPGFPTYCVTPDGVVYSCRKKGSKTGELGPWWEMKKKYGETVNLFVEVGKGKTWRVDHLVSLVFTGSIPEKPPTISRAEYQRNRYQEMNDKGLCCRCRKNPMARGTRHCEECLQACTDRQDRLRGERRESGDCLICGQHPCRESKKTCVDCAARMRGAYREVREDGICSLCRQVPAIEGKSLCNRCRKYRRKADKNQIRKLKKLVFNYYGGEKCSCCGMVDIRCLQIDHIHGGGTAHAKEVGGGARMWLWLKTNGFPDGFQVLCENCNRAKWFLGRCPHQGSPTKTLVERFQKAKKKVLNAYGPECADCGELRPVFLQVVLLDGKKEDRSTSLYARLIAEGFPKGYVILCPNCHCIRRKKPDSIS